MKGCAREEKQGQDIVVNSELEQWDRCKDAKCGAYNDVEGEHFEKTAFLPEVPKLTESCGEDDEHDDDQSCDGAWLLLQVMTGETSQWDTIECVGVQGADPTTTEPENCLFDERLEIMESASQTSLIYNVGDESSWKEPAEHKGKNTVETGRVR